MNTYVQRAALVHDAVASKDSGLGGIVAANFSRLTGGEEMFAALDLAVAKDREGTVNHLVGAIPKCGPGDRALLELTWRSLLLFPHASEKIANAAISNLSPGARIAVACYIRDKEIAGWQEKLKTLLADNHAVNHGSRQTLHLYIEESAAPALFNEQPFDRVCDFAALAAAARGVGTFDLAGSYEDRDSQIRALLTRLGN
jgi:hypothetical protein